MKIKKEYTTLEINNIIPYDKNPRINDKSLPDVIESIKQCGYIADIVVDENNVILAGHTRYKALQALNKKQIEVQKVYGLTDEQKKKYRILDNKVSEKSEWDLELLEQELETIEFDNYDFEFPDFEEIELEHEISKQHTNFIAKNVLNIEKGIFEGTGKYDIPIIKPVYKLPKIKEWIPFNYVLSDKNPKGKAVHFFIHDYQFERLFNNPEKYVDKLKRYVCVASPDFSPYSDMPMATQIYNHFRKHWVAAYLQAHGVTVIPTIRCSADARSLEWYLDGEPRNGIVIISSMWTSNSNEEKREVDVKEYQTMRDTLKPCKIFIYGKNTGNMGIDKNDPVEFIKSFSERRFGDVQR